VSPTNTVIHPSRAPAALEGRGSRPGRSYPSRAEATDHDHLLDCLAHLRTIVPAIAQELASARRQAAQLRAENGWLLEQVRQLQRGPANSNRSSSLPAGRSER